MKAPKAVCPECGEIFYKSRPNRLFCSSRCRISNWVAMHPRIPAPKSRVVGIVERRTNWPEISAIILSAKAEVPTRKMTGIYFLLQGGQIQYVGKSLNIFGRLANHITRSEFDTVAIVELPAEEIDKAEAYYIRTADPVRNTEHRPLSPKECAFCQRIFTPDWSARQYCSEECQEGAAIRRLTIRIASAPV